MKKKHVHKFMRVVFGGKKIVKDIDGKKHIEKSGGYEVFKCQIPGCNSFMPRDIVIGNVSQCWICGLNLVLDRENTTLKKPTHLQCRKVREVA